MMGRRLGPDLEVLVRLNAARIDVSKESVKKFCERAPSLQELTRLGLDVLEDCCEGADEGEMKEIYRLVEYAESHRNLLAAILQDEKLVKQDTETKAVDKVNLKKSQRNDNFMLNHRPFRRIKENCKRKTGGGNEHP